MPKALNLSRRLMFKGNNFTGDIVNPVTEARMEAYHSGPSLAKLLGLSRQYINRAEFGTYAKLNPGLLNWTAIQLGVSRASVQSRYIQFQVAVRQRTKDDIDPQMLVIRQHDIDIGRQPHAVFMRWRESYWPSVTAFSNAFCVHPEAVRTYEDGINESMPTQIRSALDSVNLIDPNWKDKIISTEPYTPV